jgi:predicted membrane channel-forming protein YqfA (hemolysin III family)
MNKRACAQEQQSGQLLLLIGGVFYITGLAFYSSDGRIPFAHAIWHLHVTAGTRLDSAGPIQSITLLQAFYATTLPCTCICSTNLISCPML